MPPPFGILKAPVAVKPQTGYGNGLSQPRTKRGFVSDRQRRRLGAQGFCVSCDIDRNGQELIEID